MDEREAACSCGQLRVRVRGEPLRISVCHCLACQRRTGSVFGMQARFEASGVRIEGESREYARAGDSGGVARFHFCPYCGGTVYYRLDAVPGVVAVPVGAFADPGFPMPRVEVYRERRHGWVSMPPGIESHD